MLDDGLENVRLEPCLVTHWERGAPEVLKLVGPAEVAGEELSVLALGGSVATPEGGLTAGVVEVTSFEELAALGDGARGKLVFFNRPMDASLVNTFEAYGGAVGQRVRGAVEAARVGAVGAIVRSMTTRLDAFPHTGGMRYADDVARVPAVAISTLGAERLHALLAAGKDVRLHLELDCRQYEDAPSFNVVGELVGREKPEEVVVLGGHLDCWDVGQGAHDDGGPCCQTIEAVRLLRSLSLRPRRTLRVVLFMNEENGLKGARAYYAAHRDEMDGHVMALESDAGAFTPRGFRTDAPPPARAVLEAIASLFAAAGAERVIEGAIGSGGADVSPMAASGVITTGYLPDPQRYFDLHHSAKDTLAEVSPRELELGAGLIAALVFVVADLSEALPRRTE
jgi:Zn-dependent M28 family amino/carboxypeptidase